MTDDTFGIPVKPYRHDVGNGFTFEGWTSFTFRPDPECSDDALETAVEGTLRGYEYEYGRQWGGAPYFAVADMESSSMFDVAVEPDEGIVVFVKESTTEESVALFHERLESELGVDLDVDRHATHNIPPEHVDEDDRWSP